MPSEDPLGGPLRSLLQTAKTSHKLAVRDRAGKNGAVGWEAIVRHLGLVLDQVVYQDGLTYTTDEVFLQFVEACVERKFDRVRYCTRVRPADDATAPYEVIRPLFEVVPLPWYRNLADLSARWMLLRPEIRRVLGAEMSAWNLCLACGIQPISVLALRLARRSGVPAAIWIRGDVLEDVRRRQRGARKILGIALIRLNMAAIPPATPVISSGRSDFAFLKRLGPVLVTYSSKFEASDFRHPRRHRSPEGRHLLYVGRIAPEKGLDVLVAAMERLIEASPDESLRLTLVGADLHGSTFGEEFREKVRRSPLAGRIRFEGHVPYGPRLFDVYDRHDALAVPSYTEGFPQVVLEAMIRGLPVVSTNVGGVPTLVRDGETGLLVPPGNPAALASALKRVLDDENLAFGLATAALDAARPYTRETQSRLVADFLGELVEERPPLKERT